MDIEYFQYTNNIALIDIMYEVFVIKIKLFIKFLL